MIKWLKNLLFPPKCIFCNDILDIKSEEFICSDCPSKIPFLNEEISLKPGDFYDGILCLFKYKGIVKNAITRYKFHGKMSYYRVFARLLAEKIKETEILQNTDMILSVPLHRNKEQKRGYNQAYLIAKELGKLLETEEQSHVLKRIRNTESQSLLPKYKRKSNVKGAFLVVHPSKIKGKSILLVDDVMTTGSTLNECSRVLKEAGAEKVFVAVLATGRNV
ncbi:MAG TPA: ComF family protein [Acetivibrio saccincola]|uniref:ComF family protein n=1 Tax=Acetivibrio saccincola TaxID=1677857 RepID=UPI002C9BCF9F|nr:ComF family protein [Acetivibrio saccincola]HOA96430.1 ComF family protein [Acetivibrio saccincola]HQD28095.1 ComF family protein [Acetivibrio saccincola]